MIWLLAAACLTQQDIWDARCDTACQREGYSGGKYEKPNCVCYDLLSADRIVRKKLKPPKKVEKREQYAPAY